MDRVAQLQADLPNQFPPDNNLDASFDEWLQREHKAAIRWNNLVPAEMTTNLPRLELLDDASILSTGDITKRDVFKLRFRLDNRSTPLTSLRLEVLPDESLPAGGPGRAYYEGRKGDFS